MPQPWGICVSEDLFGIQKRNELLKTKDKKKKRVLEEQPTIAATNAELCKSGLVAQNALRWEKACVEYVAGQLGLVGVSSTFRFRILRLVGAIWVRLMPVQV